MSVPPSQLSDIKYQISRQNFPERYLSFFGKIYDKILDWPEIILLPIYIVQILLQAIKQKKIGTGSTFYIYFFIHYFIHYEIIKMLL